MVEEDRQDARELPAAVIGLLQRLYRDPRYLLVGVVQRYGRERISFIECCTILSATGDVRGQALLNAEYEIQGRPDGEHPYGEESLLDFYLRRRTPEPVELDEDELAALRDESWQYYVRRNFLFLLGRYDRAREDADHNLGIWNLVERSSASEEAKWSYLKWWPWIERDRAVAQALWDLQQGDAEQAATELYRAQKAIVQFGERHAEEYAAEEGDGSSLCSQMAQHIAALVELLRREKLLPISLDERMEAAQSRGDQEEMERLREELIRRTMEDGDGVTGPE
jgi:hypothetical protein